MRTFQDRTGRTWNVEITVSAIKRIRDLAKVDLGQLVEDSSLAKRLDDLATLGSVLYAVVKPQADTNKVEEEPFLDSLDGAAMARAAAAFWPELDDFFRPCLPLVGGLIALAMEVRSKVRAEVPPPALATAKRSEAGPGFGSESTSSPAPSALTPAP